jgi:outer membrane protein
MRRFLAVLMLVAFCGWANSGYAGDMKFGFIDLKKVMDNYERVKDEEARLQKELNEKNDKGESLTKEVKALREKIDLLKNKQKQKKQEELDAKIKELQEFNYQLRAGLSKKRDEKLREISQDIKDVIAEYGQSRNFEMILDKMIVPYRKDKLDVTDDIIKILNQRYKK